MIEVEAGKVSFVDFRFVPLVEDENDDDVDETQFMRGEDSDDSVLEDEDEL